MVKFTAILKRYSSWRLFVLLLLSHCLQGCVVGKHVTFEDSRPNVLVIVADDLGFSDLGIYGSEISTPNLDYLASEGLMLSQFYTTPTCSPTRAMLLTGVDHHLAGLGTMAGFWDDKQRGAPGYEGYLNKEVVSVAELLRQAEYQTYMAGKWHLGSGEGYRPHNRGFEKSFALLGGGASHFSDAAPLVKGSSVTYLEDGKQVTLPNDFYSSEYYTNRMMDYIKQGLDKERPFFAYLAYTAVHWPIQVPDSYLERYSARYDDGFDILRERRIAALKEQGIINDTAVPVGTPYAAKWVNLTLEERKVESRKMEIYSAMVENLDHHIGRILSFLEESKVLENTVVIFLSDNGAEGNDLRYLRDNQDWLKERFDNRLENIGRANSYVFYGANWAQASGGILRNYKSFVSEGGIRSPAIIHYGGRGNIRSGISSEFISVADIVPTVLDFAKLQHPGDLYQGRKIYSLTGKSMVPYLKGETESVHGVEQIQCWELFGRKAVRKGNWKLVTQLPPFGSGEWQLYNMVNDPGEAYDLADQFPSKVQEMKLAWKDYEKRNNIILPANGEKPYVINK